MNIKRSYKYFQYYLLGLICITFFILGVWQLFRLQEKKVLISSITNSLNNPAIQLDDVSDPYYHKVMLEGNFLPDTIFLYKPRPVSGKASLSKTGYYVLKPFKTLSGKTVIVAAGWIESGSKYLLDAGWHKDGRHIISGLVIPTENKRFFSPKDNLEKKIWFTADISDISNFLKLNLSDFYILSEHPIDPSFIPIPIKNLIHIRNDHLEYAFTWILLGVSLLFMMMFSLRKSS